MNWSVLHAHVAAVKRKALDFLQLTHRNGYDLPAVYRIRVAIELF